VGPQPLRAELSKKECTVWGYGSCRLQPAGGGRGKNLFLITVFQCMFYSSISFVAKGLGDSLDHLHYRDHPCY
jgi:hypothetical protein